MKKNPQYNMAVTLDLDHKRKHSEAELVIKYGSNPKDKSKRIFLTTVLNRKSFSLKKASIDYRIQADAPELVSFESCLFLTQLSPRVNM